MNETDLQAKGFVKNARGEWEKARGWPKIETPLTPIGETIMKSTAKRLRQNPKPLMNKLEAEWFDKLVFDNQGAWIRAQAKRYKLANGIWYKPDFTALIPDENGNMRETAWEVKGPHAFRGGFENLKFAASAWLEVRWILVWKENGQWKEQEVLP